MMVFIALRLSFIIISIDICHCIIHNFVISTGYIFNISTPFVNEKKVLPWVQISAPNTYGLALPDMAGNEFLIAGLHDTNYRLMIVNSPQKGIQTLIERQPNCSTQALIAAIEVTMQNWSRLIVNERVEIISLIARRARLSHLQQVELIDTRHIISRSGIVVLWQQPRWDSLSIAWVQQCEFDQNLLKKSVIVLTQIVNEIKTKINDLNWFLTVFNFNHQFRKVRRTRGTEPLSYKIIKTLPVIKMNALQIMNWPIPATTFPTVPFQYDLEVFVLLRNSRISVNSSSKEWITFSSTTKSIRFQPTYMNLGSTVLHICTKGSPNMENCAVLEVVVNTLPAQVQQIHIRQPTNDYIINYTLPIAWFRSYGVSKVSDIKIISASGNVPVDFADGNKLLILNMTSLEGTVWEIDVKVLIKNNSVLPLHIMLPVLSLPNEILTSHVYRAKLTWNNKIPNNSKSFLFSIREMLNELENKTSDSFKVDNIKIKVLILRFFKESNDFLNPMHDIEFEWTFTPETMQHQFCSHHPKDITRILSNTSLSCCFLASTSVIRKRLKPGCGLKIYFTTTETLRLTRPLGPDTTFTSMNPDTNFTEGSKFLQSISLEAECGVSFVRHLPFIANFKMPKIIIIPGNEVPEWISVSIDNKTIFGIIPIDYCLRNALYMRIKDEIRDIETNVILKIQQRSSNFTDNFQIDMSFTIDVDIDTQHIDRSFNLLQTYVESHCGTKVTCKNTLNLLRIKTFGRNVQMSSVYLENSENCPVDVAIFLLTSLTEVSTFQRSDIPNSQLRHLFLQQRLGNILRLTVTMIGPCQNKVLFPPDLGQKVVYNNIPTAISLMPFVEFYNRTITFAIVDRRNNLYSQDKYLHWMQISEDSTSLIILPSIEHVRLRPYIIELSIFPESMHKLLLPKIAIEVLNLISHPYFYPFIRELNHQISVNIQTKRIPLDVALPLTTTLELCNSIDKFLRPHCTDDCGTDMLVFLNSVSDLEDNKSSINYKVSSLRVLRANNNQFRQKVKCPIEALDQMKLRLENAFDLSKEKLSANTTWIVESLKVIYMGPCAHSRTSYIKTNVLLDADQDPNNMKKDDKILPDNSQQVFIMATVIPASSFIVISFVLGLTTACLLRLKNRKKKLSLLRLNLQSKDAFNPENRIYYSYSPPSKPLILQNERPPEPFPGYEEMLITNPHALQYT